MANRYQRQRKGIILLAIISLLTMFMLIGVTYVVVSGHFKRAAISNAQSRQLGVAPKKKTPRQPPCINSSEIQTGPARFSVDTV